MIWSMFDCIYIDIDRIFVDAVRSNLFVSGVDVLPFDDAGNATQAVSHARDAHCHVPPGACAFLAPARRSTQVESRVVRPFMADMLAATRRRKIMPPGAVETIASVVTAFGQAALGGGSENSATADAIAEEKLEAYGHLLGWAMAVDVNGVRTV